ncbi:4-hydroxybenzoate octaprenyltransferase [cf. Phormidesmis sp. LEGE 11477]|uniref:4-hydroxybenzoate octaprenyltransferase n=1 Tax=cf. Phormidesmis sp. LEGE 11477 TaxID=1828680 RepID=UPI001D13890B|nr:4-hydroxybenzoate octaprenyltransferase [cf. Phormidesmis sp. LEGE 11477]
MKPTAQKAPQPDPRHPTTQSTWGQSTWGSIVRLLRWDKPEGRLILMIPALWAIFLAERGLPDLPLIGVIVLGTLATSAGGCVVNDLWDRDIDGQVERTRNRPLAAKALSVKVGIAVAFVSFICAWGLSFYLNPLSFWLCVAALPVIVLYPLAKRVFPVPQLVLSIAWGFAVLISWSAVTSTLEFATWLLWAATVFWTLGFDTIYAIPDREFDRQLGINSSALFFGSRAPEAVGGFYIGTALMLLWLGLTMSLGFFYWIAIAISTYLWYRQYRQLTRSPKSPKVFGNLFRQNVTIGFILLAGMAFSVL